MNGKPMEKLIYVEKVGVNIDGNNIYNFYYTSGDTSVIFNEEWLEPIAGLCSDNFPNRDDCTVEKIITEIEFDLVQNCMCLGMVDCMNGIVSLAWENIDFYTEYPEEGRLIFRYGEKKVSVIKKLQVRGIIV